jgi:hypothetical protein
MNTTTTPRQKTQKLLQLAELKSESTALEAKFDSFWRSL